MSKMAAVFANNLKKYRKSKGWTQEKLSEYSNLSLATIAFLETKKNLPNPTTLLKLSKALNIDEELLFASEQTTDELLKKMTAPDLSREQLKTLVKPDLALEILSKSKLSVETLKKIVPPELAFEIVSKVMKKALRTKA